MSYALATIIGMIVGSVLICGLVSRLFRWLLKGMGDTPGRIWLSCGIAYVVAVVLYGFGNANGGPWNPGFGLVGYAVGAALWAFLDLRALRQREDAIGHAAKRKIDTF